MLTKQTLLMAAAFCFSASTVRASAAMAPLTSEATLQSPKKAFVYRLYTTNILAWARGEKSGLVQDAQGPMAQALHKLVAAASNEVHMAVYGIQNQEWAFETLQSLSNKGVTIKAVVDQKAGMVGDWSPTNFTYPETARLAQVLPEDAVVPDQGDTGKARSSTIMHHKFLTVDHRYVWTGSSNLSHTCMGSEYNANASIMIDSPELAAYFDREFLEMHDEKHFGKNKSGGESKAIRYGDGTKVQVFFSPQDDAVQNAILPLIEKSKKSLDVGMFYLTDADVIEALQAASARGVRVRLIQDAVATAHPSSHHKDLRKAGIDVRVENWGGKMHMKAAIADRRDVILGSMNWTQAGNTGNDENTLLITNNPKLATELSTYFESLWSSLSHTSISYDPRAEGPNSINSCFDGIDNDHDGQIDSKDSGCKTSQHGLR